jgi:hypothetical protein
MTYAAALHRIRSWKKAKNPRKWLNLSYLNLTELPPLPYNLRRLKCYMNSLTTLEGLPKGLKQIWCNSNTLENLKGLPDGLLFISCSDNENLNSIEDIPDSVRSIRLSDCSDISTIESLPRDLEHLYIWSMGGLSKIKEFPLKLKELYISETHSLWTFKTLPAFPESLQSIHIFMTTINKLPVLPNSLKSLYLVDNYITELPPLPVSLQRFVFEDRNYKDTITIESLPPNLEYFRCDNPNLKIGDISKPKFCKILNNENVGTFIQTIESITRSVKEWGSSITYVHDEFITFELCKIAIYQDASALCSIKPHLLIKEQYYELCLESIVQHGWNIKYVSKEFQTQELADIACESSCWAIKHVLDEFKTYENCIKSVERNGETIQFVPRGLIDEKMCIAALTSKYKCLEYIPKEFITQELCTLAVKSDGENIQHVPEEFLSTEIAFLAISSSGNRHSSTSMAGGNIRFIPSKYITKELIIESLKDTPTIYCRIPKECITEEIEDIALDISPYCIQYMEQTPERCMRIIKQDPHVIICDYIQPENITREMAKYIIDLPNEVRKHVVYDELKTFLESLV